MTKVSRVKSFAVYWVHQVCREKFHDFFHHHLHTFMVFRVVFQLYKTAMSISTKTLCSSDEFSLKMSLAHLKMDESTLLTHVCADFTLSRMTMQSQEKSYSGSESEMKQICTLSASLLASSASYFLISWKKPSRFFTTTVEYFLKYFKIFHGVNFKRSKSLAGKTFRFNKNPQKLRKFSHRETFIVYCMYIIYVSLYLTSQITYCMHVILVQLTIQSHALSLALKASMHQSLFSQQVNSTSPIQVALFTFSHCDHNTQSIHELLCLHFYFFTRTPI